MLRSIVFAAVLCGAGTAQAGSFFFYDSRGNVTTGTTWNGGGFGYDSRGNVYNWTYAPTYNYYQQPAFYPVYQPAYYQPAYRAPVRSWWGW